ncbi:hypothetical protein KIP88_37115 [Bradyrhizobium sp. SRL28]|uniref:hypothetical protein n=1 Tax=Bradyrhizobium sp. SRL28 TaxID=2836178 RepID=UPI001BDF672D|nr:hypothetical protein [Bradyrhizobium sp. SRL28]MBT1516083.1 hypothetical protein [Bradyrhizobium sp. SRL28]
MTPKLPGVGPVSALLLAAVLVVWLGISGPINIESLYRWQTLLASFVAVIAATIAYMAAMAKVKQDRQISDEQILRRSLAIVLKLEFAIQILRQEARDLEKKVGNRKNQSYKTSDLAISDPQEILEAWDCLDLLPADLIQALRLLRASLILYRTDLARFDPQTDWERNTFMPAEVNPTSRANIAAKILIDQTNDTLTTLRAGIARLRGLLKHS